MQDDHDQAFPGARGAFSETKVWDFVFCIHRIGVDALTLVWLGQMQITVDRTIEIDDDSQPPIVVRAPKSPGQMVF